MLSYTIQCANHVLHFPRHGKWPLVAESAATYAMPVVEPPTNLQPIVTPMGKTALSWHLKVNFLTVKPAYLEMMLWFGPPDGVVCCLETRGGFDPVVVGAWFWLGQMSGPQQGFIWFFKHMGPYKDSWTPSRRLQDGHCSHCLCTRNVLPLDANLREPPELDISCLNQLKDVWNLAVAYITWQCAV
jgi:hypothetical protein